MAKKPNAAAGAEPGIKLIQKNRRAFHDYELISKLECGLELRGTEVKSLRDGHVTFADSYAMVDENQLFLIGMNISEYAMGNLWNHDPTRRRRLLAHKREIRKLRLASEAKGLTLIPLSIYWKRGMAKVEIALARGKAVHDKRETMRKRDADMEKKRVMRSFNR